MLSTGGGDHEFGEVGDDTIFGGAALDVLDGGSAIDQLNSWESGIDGLTGGSGTGSFFLRPGDNGATLRARDGITDFASVDAGEIQLHLYDGLTLIGTDPFSGSDQVHNVQRNGFALVQISTDADSAVDMAIKLTGTIALQSSDFLLV